MGLDEILENLERKNVSFVWKRRLTVTAFCIRMFLVGVEYAIILPSVWLYLKTFNVKTWFLGLVVAVYTIAAMISLPVVGRLYDRTRRTKEILYVMNTFEFLGSLIYALPFSPWFMLFGRFLAGLGDGFFAAANGEITRTFPSSKRIGVFALLEVGRVIGITIGPSLNFFLENIDFHIADWHIFYGPAPGLLMAIVWLLMQAVTFFMVFDLSKGEVAEEAESFTEIKLETKKKTASPDEYQIVETRIDDPVDKEINGTVHQHDDKSPLLANQEIKVKERTHSEDSSEEPSLHDAIMELFSMEILAIFYADLVLWLAQTEFEVLAPLVTQEDFQWREKYLSGIYIVGGSELIIIFVLIWYLGGKFSIDDTFMLLFSLCLTTCSLLLMIVYEAKRSDRRACIIIFLLICFLVFMSVPLNLVASKSLLTKITRPDTQGFTQGVYASVSRIALILGPVLGSSAFHNLALFGALMALGNVVAFVWLLLCLNRIKNRLEEKMR